MSRDDKLFREEEMLKERVYSRFEKMSSEADIYEKEIEERINSGFGEDEMVWTNYNELNSAKFEKRNVNSQIDSLWVKPYFSHVEASVDDGISQYLLSDCETLEKMEQIGDDCYLIPFTLEKDTAINKALFRIYYATKPGSLDSYKGPNGDAIVISPRLICDTEIKNRELLGVNLKYSVSDVEGTRIEADEMLAKKLEENRDDPELANIISTLQMKQFDIISTDVTESFAVQGCAGSGKSQCLLHRLFFLRTKLSKEGWDKVLLLTPTKLFREYSADLIKRFGLSDVYNCSIGDLYLDILKAYDDRFKERQYIPQLTEEYLSDAYLHDVYDEENVKKIEAEIDDAIKKYVLDGCNALGIEMPSNINISQINILVSRLDKQIEAFDAREGALQNDVVYQEKRNEYEQLLEESDSTRKKLLRLQNELEKITQEEKSFADLATEVDRTRKSLQSWKDARKKKIHEAKCSLEIATQNFEEGVDICAPAIYAKQLSLVREVTEGDIFKRDEERLAELEKQYNDAYATLQEKTQGGKNETIVNRYQERQTRIQDEISAIKKNIAIQNTKIEECDKDLRKIITDFEGQEARNTLLRSEMIQARYFLSRIESTIFEKEVWNVLSETKKKYDIQTLQIEELEDGKHKESRLLYKADLLFYVRIYMKLHSKDRLPTYSFICIDEGQDLHRADYDVLHGLYPNAIFNVFGDVAQVLHASCGISDWKKQSGIQTVYSLETNYRNTATIVDFCNNEFDVNMEYLGSIEELENPIMITNFVEAQRILKNEDVTVIVKDREAYLELCRDACVEDKYAYLDTQSDTLIETGKRCYSIFAAKGLEFTNVFVYAKNMTNNQKVVACTRAMKGLYYYE